MEKIVVQDLYKIFGPHPQKALKLLKAGENKASIQESTGMTVGVDNASFAIASGEIFVCHGTVGLRQIHHCAHAQPPD